MKIRYGAAIIAVTFGMGGCLGAKTSSPDVEFVKIREPAVVKTVTVIPETDVQEVLPESCVFALRYAARASSAATKIYASSDRQLDLISQARQRLADQDALSLQPVDEAQRALQAQTIGNVKKIEDALYLYNDASKECEEEAP